MPEFLCETCYQKHSATPDPCRCGAISPSLSIFTQEWNHDIQLSHREAVIVDRQLDTQQRVFAKLEFGASYRRDGEYTELSLRMKQLDFGVEGCIQTRRELGHIIQEVDIEVEPFVAWAGQCTRVTAKPCISPRTFSMQQSTTLSANISPLKIRASTLGCQRSEGVSWEADAFGWSTASVEPMDSKHVRWNWTLKKWLNGACFPTKACKSKSFRGGIPELPVNPLSIPYHSHELETEFEARWLVPHRVLTELRHIQWNLKVDIYTAHFRERKRGFWGHVGSFGHPLSRVNCLTFGALPEERSRWLSDLPAGRGNWHAFAIAMIFMFLIYVFAIAMMSKSVNEVGSHLKGSTHL